MTLKHTIKRTVALATLALAALALTASPAPADPGGPDCINPEFDPESPELWFGFWQTADVPVADERGSVEGLEMFVRTNHCRDFGPFLIRPQDPGEQGNGWLGGYGPIIGDVSPHTVEFFAAMLDSVSSFEPEVVYDGEYDSGE